MMTKGHRQRRPRPLWRPAKYRPPRRRLGERPDEPQGPHEYCTLAFDLRLYSRVSGMNNLDLAWPLAWPHMLTPPPTRTSPLRGSWDHRVPQRAPVNEASFCILRLCATGAPPTISLASLRFDAAAQKAAQKPQNRRKGTEADAAQRHGFCRTGSRRAGAGDETTVEALQRDHACQGHRGRHDGRHGGVRGRRPHACGRLRRLLLHGRVAGSLRASGKGARSWACSWRCLVWPR